MKCTYLLLFLLLWARLSFGQSDTVYQYLDNNHKQCDENNAVYKRIAIKKNKSWLVEDLYIYEQTLAMSETCTDDSLKIPEGLFQTFYADGAIKNEGHYVNGRKNGPWINKDEDGVVYDSSFFKDGMPLGMSYRWTQGHLRFKGKYDTLGKGTGEEWTYYDDGKLSVYGKYAEGFIKDSTWTYYFNTGKISCKEYYLSGPYIKKDSLLKRECYDEEGNLQAAKCEDIMPQCHCDLNDYLRHTVHFPSDVSMNAKRPFSRRVVANFTVNEDGTISDIKIIIHGGILLDKETMRVVKKMPRWDPGISWNRPVKVNFTLPIVYKLD